MSDPLKVDLKDASRITDDIALVGCLNVETPDGVVHFHDGPESLITILENNLGQSSVAIFAYSANNKTGLVTQYSAHNAREIAAALMQAANTVDPTGKH